jgi:hypothetical protein
MEMVTHPRPGADTLVSWNETVDGILTSQMFDCSDVDEMGMMGGLHIPWLHDICTRKKR